MNLDRSQVMVPKDYLKRPVHTDGTHDGRCDETSRLQRRGAAFDRATRLQPRQPESAQLAQMSSGSRLATVPASIGGSWLLEAAAAAHQLALHRELRERGGHDACDSRACSRAIKSLIHARAMLCCMLHRWRSSQPHLHAMRECWWVTCP